MTDDRTRRDTPDKAADILTCDHCRTLIDDLELGMIFWDAPGDLANPPGDDQTVTTLIIAHKKCEGRRPDATEFSAELDWFVDGRLALKRVAGMASDYRFTGAQLQRVVDVAWAVAWTASDEDRKKAWERYEEFGL